MAELAQIPMRRGRILVVDDDLLIRRMMRRTLEAAYDVVEASDGAEALEALRADPAGFHLVLCDLEMPRMSGAELCAQLASTLPELLDHLVIVTGGARTQELDRFVAAREPLVLHKPFDLDELRELAARRVRARLAAAS